jgi:PIN domain nuclease of toxin-antitoxin system
MRLLLDTHSFLLFISGDEQMSGVARNLIGDINNDVLLSVASLWEIAIKVSIGKLALDKSFEAFIPEQLFLNEIEVLPIGLDDLSLVASLPFHHRDPFDRLIIAQAMTREIPIVGKDSAFAAYPVELIWQRQPRQRE